MANNEQSPVLTLEVYRGGALVQRADFTESSITIGRGAAALLQVDDPGLAELHAVINVEENGSIALLDLGSDTGITVQGARVPNAELRSGDRFDVGGVSIRVVAGGDFDSFDDDDATHVASSFDVGAPAPIDEVSYETPAPAAPRAAFDDGDGDGDDDSEDDDSVEDIMEFILRSGTSTSTLGIDKKRPMVLEVNQIWGNSLLDTKHFHKRSTGHDISIGSSIGWKWHLLGIDMGWVPDSLRHVLPFTPPMWSEVNSAWRDDFYASDEALPGGAQHTLFKHDVNEEKYTAHIDRRWDGFVDIDDKRYTFEELAQAGKARATSQGYEIPMEPGVRLMVDIDGIVFFSHMVHPGARILDKASENLDYPFLAILSLMGFLGIMFGVVMYFSPKSAQNQMVEIPDRFVELLLEKPEPEQKKENKKPEANPDAGEGAKAKREEGKVGKKDAKMEKAKGNKVEVKKQELDRQIAENAGVLGALRESGELDGMFGSTGLDANLRGGIGGLIGAKGTQIGSGGLGARGSGLGGGGTAEGLGGLGTKGIGSGASGYGSGGGNFGAKGEGGIGRVGGDPIILGALDRSLIDEVIKRHMNQIRYCYQRELTKNPALGGKIVIKFVIAKDGTVSSASTKETTMNNAAVQGCIEGRFMRMQFPEPKGGGIVIVSYPFIFTAG